MAPAIAFIGANLGAIGAAVSAIGAISSAVQQRDAAKYNESMANQQALAAQQTAAANAERQRRAAQRQIGSMEASYAASGVSIEGSPMEILEQSAREAELDRLNILYGGAQQAAGYRNTAALEGAKSQNAMTSGILKAGSSLMIGMNSSARPYGSAGADIGNYGSVWDTELPETKLWRA